jgi:hypothetical protein
LTKKENGSFKSTTGKEGKLGEKYVRLDPNGHYSVMIKRKRYGTFKTLEEAIAKRDEAVKELTKDL